MGRPNGYTAEQMINAIQKANGILAGAAKELGCSRTTVHRYVNNMPTVRDAYEDARETLIDFTEQQLYKQIKNGNVTAIIFTLKTIGKHRGYVERQELTGANNGPVTFKVVYDE